jgi:hypothetical protein
MKKIFSNMDVLFFSTNSSCVQEDLLSNGDIDPDIGCDDVERHLALMRRSVGISKNFMFHDVLRVVGLIGTV